MSIQDEKLIPLEPQPDAEVKFDHELLYQRSEGSHLIRFRNNLRNDEMRTVMVGLFLGFKAPEDRQDILRELRHYAEDVDAKPSDIAMAIAGGLQTGSRLA